MQRIVDEALRVLPDFQMNGIPVQKFKYCEIARGQNGNGTPILVKMVGGEIDQYMHGDVREKILDELAVNIDVYYRLLKASGVGVNEFFTVHRTERSILEITNDGGRNISELLHDASPQEARQLISMMIETLLPALEAPELGIDGKPDNFTVKGDRANYVDFIPARYLKDGIPLVGIPQPPPDDPIVSYLHERYFTVCGILRRLWFTLAIYRNDAEGYFFDTLNSALPAHLGQMVRDYFTSLPFNRLRAEKNRDRILTVLEEFGDRNIDDIRELSTLFLDSKTRGWIMHLTSIDLFKPPDERLANVAKAKQLILHSIKNPTAPIFFE